MKLFVNHLDLWLAAAGVTLIFLVPWSLDSSALVSTNLTALTAIAVGLAFAGVIFVGRHRQRVVRAGTIDDVQRMLSDRINNQLSVISGRIDAAGGRLNRRDLDEVQRAIDEVSMLLRTLGETTLRVWRDRYGTAVESLRPPMRGATG